MFRKRIFAAVLAVLLLAGCAAGEPQGTSEGTAQSTQGQGTAAQAGTAPETTEHPAAKPDLHRLEHGDENGYYFVRELDAPSGPNPYGQYCYADFAAGTAGPVCSDPDCTHDSLDCPAIYQNGVSEFPGREPYVLDENTLLVFSYIFDPDSLTAAVPVLTMDRSCGSRKIVTQDLTGWRLGEMYTDGQTVYYAARHLIEKDGVITSDAAPICALDPATGEVRQLAECGTDTFLCGCAGRSLVLQEFLSEPDSAGMTGLRYSLLDVDTGEMQTLREYQAAGSSGAIADDFGISAAVLDGKFYEYSFSTGLLTETDPLTGETRTVTDAIPSAPTQSHGTPVMSLSRILNGELVAEYDAGTSAGAAYLVDLNTGEVREKPALPAQYRQGSSTEPIIYQQLADRLVISTRAEPYTETTLGTDGSPYTSDMHHLYFGLISYDDYLTGTPNYTELGLLY